MRHSRTGVTGSRQEYANALTAELDPLTVAEDDRLRSRYVQHLISASDAGVDKIAASIPRILVQFWDDTKSVPADVRECLNSWQPLVKQGFELLLFDDSTAAQFIADHFDPRYLAAFEKCTHPAMRADYFRLCFILNNGGFYVDADDVYQGGDWEPLFHDSKLKLQALCYRISTDSMVDPIEALSSQDNTSDLIFYVNNNPLVAPPEHPVIRIALERSTQNLLIHAEGRWDVQSTTGPGNLTASLVRHAIESEQAGADKDFVLLSLWSGIAVSRWPLDYRNDKRNWRLWDGRIV